MRFLSFEQDGIPGLAVWREHQWRGWRRGEAGWPGSLDEAFAAGARLDDLAAALAGGPEVRETEVTPMPPLCRPPKILCIGLNYADHTKESPYEQPPYPTVFARFSSSLVGHGQPVFRPRASEQLDYEGELAAVIGRGGRHIAKEQALEHVAAYSIFNDASIRDYQFKSPQWTVGKNFDATGAFGPVLVTADELPPGAVGLRLETRLNGQTVQAADTRDMLFDVATLVALLSDTMTLEPGDVIVTGTPAGTGMGRKPPLWMRAGDVVEVEVENIGVLRNPIADEDR
jgi:2-keto-4-pentenoate hydratase/2-oxohepta-3-ene-1,7-dioic acid hydratase in catechol pathway